MPCVWWIPISALSENRQWFWCWKCVIWLTVFDIQSYGIHRSVCYSFYFQTLFVLWFIFEINRSVGRPKKNKKNHKHFVWHNNVHLIDSDPKQKHWRQRRSKKKKAREKKVEQNDTTTHSSCEYHTSGHKLVAKEALIHTSKWALVKRTHQNICNR